MYELNPPDLLSFYLYLGWHLLGDDPTIPSGWRGALQVGVLFFDVTGLLPDT